VHGLVIDNAAWDTPTSRIVDAKQHVHFAALLLMCSKDVPRIIHWAATPSSPARGSGERCELPQRGLGRGPDHPKVFHYFQHSGWPLLTL